MNVWMIVWLVVIALSVVIEVATFGLTTIWLTGGALVALVLSLFNVPWPVQIVVCLVVTLVLLFFTRPLAVKYMNKKQLRTNYEETIGQKVRITEKVDNMAGTGKAVYKGMDWTARAIETDAVFEVDEIAIVRDVQGVKLMLEKE